MELCLEKEIIRYNNCGNRRFRERKVTLCHYAESPAKSTLPGDPQHICALNPRSARAWANRTGAKELSRGKRKRRKVENLYISITVDVDGLDFILFIYIFYAIYL